MDAISYLILKGILIVSWMFGAFVVSYFVLKFKRVKKFFDIK